MAEVCVSLDQVWSMTHFSCFLFTVDRVDSGPVLAPCRWKAQKIPISLTVLQRKSEVVPISEPGSTCGR